MDYADRLTGWDKPKTRYDKAVQWKNPVKLDMLELTGYRCREHARDDGAKGKTDCHSCNDVAILFDRYGL